MRKDLLGFALLALTFITSCKEVGTVVDLSPIVAKDTTYIAATESATPRVVLVEEATGVRCPNCPDGAVILKNIDDANPNRMIAIGVHSGSLTAPIDGASKYDLTSKAAADLFSFFGGGPDHKPVAVVDRIKGATGLYLDKGVWQSNITTRFSVPSNENITITNSYDSTSRQAIIKVRVAYTSDVSVHQNLTVGIIENNIIDAQEYTSYIDTFYQHNHVLRDFLTPASGSAVLDSFATKKAGRVYERIFIYNVDSKWNAANCEVFAYVFKNESGQDYEIAQAAKKSLK